MIFAAGTGNGTDRVADQEVGQMKIVALRATQVIEALKAESFAARLTFAGQLTTMCWV